MPLRHGAGRRNALALLAWACAVATSPVAAAPLDEWLSALPGHPGHTGYIEAAVDRVNGTLRYFRNRDDQQDPDNPAATPADGDYSGAHLAAAWQAHDRLRLDASLWQRRIRSDADNYRYRSWSAGAQWRFHDGNGVVPALAVRLAAWGNDAKATRTTTPLRVQGAILNTATVSEPSDRQTQVDLIASWPLSPALTLNAWVGVGRSKLGYQGLSATTVRNGCTYDLAFNGNDIFGTLVEPCTTATSVGVIRQFYDSSGEYGVDVANEIAWSGRYQQLGLGLGWRTGAWTLRGAVLAHRVNRVAVDDILARRGDPVHRSSELLSLQAEYHWNPQWTLLLRTQISSNLFLSEMPVTYNSSTSDSFGNKLSLLSVGLRWHF